VAPGDAGTSDASIQSDASNADASFEADAPDDAGEDGSDAREETLDAGDADHGDADAASSGD
jgi:hypothetical protein